MRVEKKLVIDGEPVEEVENLGLNYRLYRTTSSVEDGYGERYYIAYDGVVMFAITAVANGDCCAHISEFYVKLLDKGTDDE